MRTFEMVRNNDETGVSGRGKVVEGVVFSDGTCVTRWTTEASTGRSTNIWDSFGAFVSVHVTPHPSNKTVISFSDGEIYEHINRTEGSVPKVRRRRKASVPKVVEGSGPIQVGVQSDATKPPEVLRPETTPPVGPKEEPKLKQVWP